MILILLIMRNSEAFIYRKGAETQRKTGVFCFALNDFK
jgi:hypothetical protein